MYNPKDETKSYVIGDTYTFKAPAIPDLPTATVTEVENEDLTFAMNFKADEVTDEQLAYYGSWYADYVLTVNKEVTFNADSETADGYLAGSYEAYNNGQWVKVPFEDVTLEAGESIKIMEYAATLLGEEGLKLTYNDVYSFVKDFDCGVYFTPEFLAANPDLEVTLELRMYNPKDETKSYVIGDTYTFTLEDAVAINMNNGKLYSDVLEGLFDADDNETVALLKSVDNAVNITVPENVTFDLNGYALKTRYFSCYGDTVDDSENNGGLLKVNETRILMQKTNKQLPVKTTEGYKFFEVLNFNQATLAVEENGKKYVFQPLFEVAAHEYIAQGAASGVTVNTDVSWKQTNGTRTQQFVFSDDYVSKFIETYNSSTGKYGQMFTLTIKDTTGYENLVFNAVVRSETGVEFSAN